MIERLLRWWRDGRTPQLPPWKTYAAAERAYGEGTDIDDAVKALAIGLCWRTGQQVGAIYPRGLQIAGQWVEIRIEHDDEGLVVASVPWPIPADAARAEGGDRG